MARRILVCILGSILFVQAGLVVTARGEEENKEPAYEAEMFTAFSGGTGAAIAFDGNGNMFVGIAGALLRVTPDGQSSVFCSLRDLPSGRNYFFKSPLIWDIAFDAAGNILAAAQDRILSITKDGQVTTLVREDFMGFLGATGVEVDGNGSVYMTNGFQIIKYSPDFKKKTVFIDSSKSGTMYFTFFSLEFDPEFNNLYVTDFETSTLLRYPIKANGSAGAPAVVVKEPIKNARPYGAPLNITAGPDGKMYVSLDCMGQILRVDKEDRVELIKMDTPHKNHVIAFGGRGFDPGSIYFTTYNGEGVYRLNLMAR